MAATSDADLFERLERDTIEMDEIIARAIAIKKSVVEQDEKETGLRKVLNFGHTLAHAVESGAPELYHGECVAIGMLPMCAPAVRPRLEAVLKRLGLPTAPRGHHILEAMRHDKKRAGDRITVVYLPEIGQAELREITMEELEERMKKAVQL